MPRSVDVVELTIKEQYINRQTMYFVKSVLLGKTVRIDECVDIGGCSARATISHLKAGSSSVEEGEIGAGTRVVFRSHSAKLFLLVQVSSEMWDPIPGCSYLPLEVLLYKFLPEYIDRLERADCNHSVSIVLFGRVYVEDSWKSYDFCNSIVSYESCRNLSARLDSVRKAIAGFKQSVFSQVQSDRTGSLYLSKSFDGNWLEASNLAATLLDRHNLSRDFCRTGLAIVTLTAGQSMLFADYKLAQLLKYRTSYNGIFCHLVCFNRPPLHPTPNIIFSPGSPSSMQPWFNCSFYLGKPYDLRANFRFSRPDVQTVTIDQAIRRLLVPLVPETNEFASFKEWLHEYESSMANSPFSGNFDHSFAKPPSPSEPKNVPVPKSSTVANVASTSSCSSANSASNGTSFNRFNRSNPIPIAGDQVERSAALYVHDTSPLSHHKKPSKGSSFCSNAAQKTALCLSPTWDDVGCSQFNLIPDSLTVDWRSLASVPCLPVETDTFPSGDELLNSYKKYSYTLIPSAESVLCRTGDVLMALVHQRLLQGFQLYTQESVGDKKFHLSLGLEIHIIAADQNCILIDRYISNDLYTESTSSVSSSDYSLLIKGGTGPGQFEDRRLKFVFPSMASFYNWNYFDYFITGYNTRITASLKCWQKRFILVPHENAPRSSSSLFINPSNESLSNEEYRIAGFFKFVHFLQDWRLTAGGTPYENDKKLDLDNLISVYVISDSLFNYLEKKYYMYNENASSKEQAPVSSIAKLSKNASISEIEKILCDPVRGLPIRDAKWHYRSYKGVLVGCDFVDWTMRNVHDIESRREATAFGQHLMDSGIIEHYHKKHSFLDGFYYYKLAERSCNVRNQQPFPTGCTESPLKEPIPLTRPIVVNVDPQKRSSHIEWAVLHYDTIYNTASAFHLNIHWLTCNPRLLDEAIKCWARKAYQCGYYFYETPVVPYDDSLSLSILSFPVSITLAAIPPDTDCPHVQEFYVNELFKSFNFIVDFEPDDRLLREEIARYSFEKTPTMYKQYVHVSGEYFVLFYGTNTPMRLMENSTRSNFLASFSGSVSKAQFSTRDFVAFCTSKESLAKFYTSVREKSKSQRRQFVFNQ